MKTKKYLLLLFGAIISLPLLGQTNYTSTGDGDYSDAVWDVQAPDPIPSGDTVFINHTITLDAQLDVDGVLYIGVNGKIDGNKKLKNEDEDGAIVNYGEINITQELHIDGDMFNYNYCYAKKFHNDGYICNTDTMEMDPTQTYDLHGGELDCGGTTIFCKMKIHDGNQGTVNISNQNLDTCNTSSSCNGNQDIDFQDPATIDSTNTYVCNANLQTGIILPVELLYANALLVDNEVVLEWATATEINNDYFTIERSAYGDAWEPIGMVDGKGTTSATNKYTFVDPWPLKGNCYYRIKQTDYNFESSYSPLMMVNTNVSLDQNWQLAPNPAQNEVTLLFDQRLEENVSIRVSNAMGQVVNVQTLPGGIGTVVMDLQNYPVGLYFFEVTGSNGVTKVQRLVKNQ